MNERPNSRWKLRLTLYATGVVLLVGSLLGAHALSTAHSSEPTKADSKLVGASKLLGPVVLGTVDSNHQQIPYLLPPVLQSGTIAKRCVNDGDVVHAGDTLYVFDTTPLQRSLEVAKSAVEVAKSKKAEAEKTISLHDGKIKTSELAVIIAARYRNLKEEQGKIIQHNLEKYYKAQKADITPQEIEDKLRNDDMLFAARAEHVKAGSEWELKKRELQMLKDGESLLDLEVKHAQAVVNQAEAEVNKARPPSTSAPSRPRSTARSSKSQSARGARSASAR